MRKLFLTLGAVLVFGIASAQTDTARTKVNNKTTQTQRRATDTRTSDQKRVDAQKNINDLEKNTNRISTPATPQPSINTNSSATPQLTPPVSPPPPGAPVNPGAPVPAAPTTPANPGTPVPTTPRQ